MANPYQPKPDGSAWAAILSVSIGCAAFGLLTDASEVSPWAKQILGKFYPPAGDLPGKSTLAVVVWIVAWAALRLAWRDKMLRRPYRVLLASAALILFALMTTFPPFFELITSAHAAAPTQPVATLVVSADGHGQYTTVQAAIDAVPDNPTAITTIHILPGIYKERIIVPVNKPHLRFVGDDAAATVLTNDIGANMLAPDGKPLGTFKTQTVQILADDFHAANITFENTYGNHGQALAAEVSGDRDAFEKCRFLGWQDTLYTNAAGRNYFHNCLIAGHVDFIFGKSTALFDHCEIRSKEHGYLTAASTAADVPFGFVFLDCDLTADAEVKPGSVYLGRPWRDAAAVAFIRCRMGNQINPTGWNNWKKPEREKTARYAEYGSIGPGANAAARVAWAKQLTAEEAKAYSIDHILNGDGPKFELEKPGDFRQ